MLGQLERKVLWLSTWMIHNANHLRPSRDGLKVGGHQSSSASVATLMTALYLHTLRPEDRVALTFEYVTSQDMNPWWRLISNMKDSFAYFGFRQVFSRRRRSP